MKTIKILILVMLLAAPVVLSAQVPGSQDPATAGTVKGMLDVAGEAAEFSSDTEDVSLPKIIGGVIQTFLSLLGVVFMSYTLYAGSLWITARGDEEKITKAKSIIRGGIIGLIIVFAAYFITGFILNALVTGTAFEGSTV